MTFTPRGCPDRGAAAGGDQRDLRRARRQAGGGAAQRGRRRRAEGLEVLGREEACEETAREGGSV